MGGRRTGGAFVEARAGGGGGGAGGGLAEAERPRLPHARPGLRQGAGGAGRTAALSGRRLFYCQHPQWRMGLGAVGQRRSQRAAVETRPVASATKEALGSNSAHRRQEALHKRNPLQGPHPFSA